MPTEYNHLAKNFPYATSLGHDIHQNLWVDTITLNTELFKTRSRTACSCSIQTEAFRTEIAWHQYIHAESVP